MTGKISLDTTLQDCEVGVEKLITLKVVPTANDAETGFQADVTEVPDYEEDSGDYAKEAKGMEKHAPAVVIAIAKKK